MTYKETLFFIGKCLTITHESKNKEVIEKKLKLGNVDWDNVVKLSTSHYVFPALYCNLKRANFLHYLPNDLVEYMKHITDLNRERNRQIIAQAKEINELLLANNIIPIFLKGTGNLLEGLYEDIAERMVGDIDFIFSKNDYPNAIKVLTKNNYSKVHQTTYDFPSFKHYPRLQKKDKTAAIEIHKEILLEKYADEFNYDIIKNDTLLFNNINVMSYENQLSLSIIAKQINDSGFYFKNIALRNAYDVFLLSKKTNAKSAFNKFNKLQHPLNCFLATCFIVFGKVDSLKFTKTPETKSYISFFEKMLINDSFRKKHLNKTSKKLFIKERLAIIFKTFYNSEMRTWFFNRITDKQWYKEKASQLGLRN